MDPAAMTAAHRTPSFGTEVIVINHDNGRSAVVRTEVRLSGRATDLSPATVLAPDLEGLVSVSLIVGGAENAPQKRKSLLALSFLTNSRSSQQPGGSLE
jgi:rare lipoprotein A (peptidoglycan hydrolase)